MTVPSKNPNYVTWGNFDKIEKIILSKKFFPVWITGEAGVGKSVMVEEACARNNRDFWRVNFTQETTEDDLFGGFQLEGGNTVFHEGPVTQAMKAGGVLLLDELDAASCNRVLALQSVLEGKGVLIKSINKYVEPAPGFTIFSTSNTKGRGSDSGRYVGTSIMNAAFLDRFSGMIHQDYPPYDIEEEILQRYWKSYNWSNINSASDIDPKEVEKAGIFIASILYWANQIRETFKNGACEEVITTRSLISIVQSFAIFGDQKLALEMCCERFSNATKESFLSMYDKLIEKEWKAETK